MDVAMLFYKCVFSQYLPPASLPFQKCVPCRVKSFLLFARIWFGTFCYFWWEKSKWAELSCLCLQGPWSPTTAVWISKVATTYRVPQETFHGGPLLLLTADMIEGEQEVVIYGELSRELDFHFFIEVRRPVSKAHCTWESLSKNDAFSNDPF